MSTEKQYIYFRESFLQSVLSDIVTFGWLLFSIWFSADSDFWSFVCFALLVLAIWAGADKKRKVFTSVDKLQEYVDTEFKARQGGD